MFGIDLSPEGLLTFFSAYAYQPWLVYGFIIVFMLASSFGFPVPEELVLISSGLVAFLAKNPDKFPPPSPDAVPVDMWTLMIVCFLAVFLSDFLVYSIGKYLGKYLLKYAWMQKQVNGKAYAMTQKWFDKYGTWCCGIFRFTPGLRFPGHIWCGMLGIPVWKFVLIDGAAALFSVPTQVYLVATYGEHIIGYLQEVKYVTFGILLVAFIVWFVRKKIKERQAPSSVPETPPLP